jgi:hypothetical protein
MAGGEGGNSVERKLGRVEGMAGGGRGGEQCGKEAVKSRRNCGGGGAGDCEVWKRVCGV